MKRMFAATLAGCMAAPLVAQDPPLAHFYGFEAPEIYKLDQRVANLLVIDLNGDGLNDVVVVNNLRNRLDVLTQLKTGVDEQANIGLDVNEVPTANRMALRKIEMQRPVGGLAIHDMNGDGRPDLVYVSAEPASLNIEFQNAEGKFGDRRSFEIDEILAREWTHDVGDINGDGVPDVVFLGKENLYVLEGGKGGRFGEPRKFRLSGTDSALLRIVDVDHDGRNDVVFSTQDPQFPVRLRLQDKNGRLGPENQLEVEKIRALSWGRIDAGKPGATMLTVSDLTSRILVHRLTQSKPREGVPPTQFLTYPFEKSSAAPGAVAVADFDGDSKLDVAVADPAGARVLLHRQIDATGLDLGRAYPTMVGTSVLRPLSMGAGKSGLLVLSPTDKAAGLMHWDQNRLTFPEPLPTKDEPAALEVMGTGADARVLYVARVEDSTNFTEKFFLRALKPTAGERTAWTKQPLGGKDQIEVALSAKPTDMRSVDANGDGKEDLLFFVPGEDAPTLWLQGADGGFAAAPKTGQGTLAGVGPAAIGFVKLGGDRSALMVAQGNYIRNMKFEADGRWRVVDQINAPTAQAKLQGVSAVDFDGDGKKELVLYDRTGQTLEVLQERDGRWERAFQRKIGAFGLRTLQAGDFNGDGKDDLLIADNDKMGVLYAGRTDLKMEVVASYESNNRRGQLFDVAVGDLNNDGRPDLLAMDSRDHNLEIVAVQGGDKLVKATAWKVFEEKTFRSAAGRNIEPREIVVGDVNGDSRQDILTLAHDRLIVYLQDSGDAPIAAAPKTAPKKADAPMARSVAANAKPTTAVQDGGRFFKADTIVQAKELAAAIKSKHRKDVVVESFAGIPESDKVKFNQLDKAGQDRFVANWASTRAGELKTDGVYILICRSPAKLYVHSAKRSVDEATVDAVRKTMVQAFMAREFDRGLLDSLKTIGANLDSKGQK